MLFDGIANYVQVPSSTTISPTGTALSVSVWVKRTIATNYAGIVMKGLGIAPHNGYRLREWDDGSVKFQIRDAIGNDYSAAVSLTNAVWTHIVGVYNGVNVLIYKNSVLTTGNAYAGNIIANTTALTIGRQIDDATRFFNGVIDDVRIYNNRALSPSEVLSVMKGIPVPDGLVLHYDFWGPRGSDGTLRIRDLSPSGNHGTNSGSKQVPLPDFPPLYKS